MKKNTAKAIKLSSYQVIKLSVFGSLTYFLDGDMFYGQDNLQLVKRAERRPFK